MFLEAPGHFFIIVSNEFYLFFKCIPTYVTTFGFKICKFHYFFSSLYSVLVISRLHWNIQRAHCYFILPHASDNDIRYTIYKGHRFISLVGYRLWFLHLKNAIFLKDTYPAIVLNEMNAHIGLVLGLGFVQDLNVIQYTSLFSTVSKNCISQ